MKAKFFSQIFFSFLVLALGVWAFYEYKQSEKEQKIKEAPFFNNKLEDLKAFRITKGAEELEIVKEGRNWILKKPVRDLASFTEISRWFDEIKNQRVQKIQTNESINWKDYYLDKAPRAEMEFASGEFFSFSVSKKSSFDGKRFIKKNEELFIGESYFASEVNEKDFDSFRSKKLLPAVGHATKIQWKGKSSFTLHWKNYKWSFPSHKKTFPLDFHRLDGFWTETSMLKASALKEAVSPLSLRKYGLNNPQLEIHFSYPDKKKNYSLKLSPFQEDKAFVLVSTRKFILEISKEDAKKLILSQKEIWDHAFPFNYEKNSISQIRRKNSADSFEIKKEKDIWQSLNKEKKAIDTKKVEELLDKTQALRGERYKAGSIKQAKRSLEMKNSKGALIFELREFSTEGAYSWIKTNLWNEWIAVSTISLDEIFNQNIDLTPQKKIKTEEEKNLKKSGDF